MSKGTEHQQGGDGYILNTNQSVAGPEVMKLLKDSFNDEIVSCAVCKPLDAYVLAGLLHSDCHFSYKSMKHGTSNFSDNPSKFVFGTSIGKHAIHFLGFDEDLGRFE
eukprot:12225680-Ditylum_brightwellii.AAC.1